MRNLLKRSTTAFVAAAFLGLASTQFGAASPSSLTIGAPAPQFTLPDQDGKPVSLSDFAGKVVVLEWTNPQCPFVQRHYKEKTMTTLADQYKDRGVVWLAINSTHDVTNAADKSWADENHLPYPVLNDAAGGVGHLYDAKSTPDMYVITRAGTLAYSGAIDNDPQGERSADRVNYVRQALDAVLADQPAATPKTKSYGCAVHYAK